MPRGSESSLTSSASTGECAVVVGAYGAFGAQIVAALVDAGLIVVAVARSSSGIDALIARHGDKVVGCVANIADDAAIADITAALRGPVRMVVHAPGVPVAGGVTSVATGDVAMAVNIKVNGMLRLVRSVDGRLVPGARLVAIGGHYGFEPSPYAATAGIANAALANLVRQLSWAYGGRRVTAHLIAPGPADTERLHRIAAQRMEREGVTPEVFFADLNRESAIGRLTTPAQVAWAVAMLLAPEADALAGSSLMLDSGRRRGLP